MNYSTQTIMSENRQNTKRKKTCLTTWQTERYKVNDFCQMFTSMFSALTAFTYHLKTHVLLLQIIPDGPSINIKQATKYTWQMRQYWDSMQFCEELVSPSGDNQ